MLHLLSRQTVSPPLPSSPAPMSPAPRPLHRMRRMRRTAALRDLVRESHLRPEDLILPLFVDEGIDEPLPIKTMPGVFRIPEKQLGDHVRTLAASGVRSVILFGVSYRKDAGGTDSLAPNGLLARMIRSAKNAAPDLIVIADLCFCEYTDHGHCGPLDETGDVDNDATIEQIALQAVNCAQAGADIVAPSGMMDGQVAAIRAGLDQSGYAHTPIMAYAAKYASCFYGPFRLAAGCALGQHSHVRGDRKSYQMDPANRREAIREALLDAAEGADMLMVKPGMAYLDIIRDVREASPLPLAAYQVSGEYAMIQFAAEAGAIDRHTAMMESLIAFKRAGCDLILSYFTQDAVRALQA